MIRHLYTLLLALLSLLLSGCSPAMPNNITELPACDIDTTLTHPCQQPSRYTHGMTFGDLIHKKDQDAKNLKICSDRHQKLVAAARSCAESIEKTNQLIQAFNKRVESENK